MENYFYHHGILGMRWGIHRTPAQLARADNRWAKRKSDKITAKAKKESSKELNEYGNELMKNPNSFKSNGKLTSATINSYNRKMAELMSQKVSGLTSPSGRVVNFVAKRGEIGVFMALSDQGYNINQLKNGIWNSGKVAYRKTMLDKIEN